jgi:flagellar assembly factor FliW
MDGEPGLPQATIVRVSQRHRFETEYFGLVEFDEQTVLEFPCGLPAFESERRFLVLEPPATAPLVFLQSLQTPGLVFMTIPIRMILPDYRLAGLGGEDLEVLGGDASQPELILAILTFQPGRRITANLMAPIVVNTGTRKAVQVIQAESGYQIDYPLASQGDQKC